MNYRPIITIQE